MQYLDVTQPVGTGNATVSNAPDTAEGQLLHPELDAPSTAKLNYSRMPVSISQHDLIVWWSEGLINDAAYIFFALKVERVGREGIEDFDLEKFITDWAGYKGADQDKEKLLKAETVTSVLQKLQQKGAATVQVKLQLQMGV